MGTPLPQLPRELFKPFFKVKIYSIHQTRPLKLGSQRWFWHRSWFQWTYRLVKKIKYVLKWLWFQGERRRWHRKCRSKLSESLRSENTNFGWEAPKRFYRAFGFDIVYESWVGFMCSEMRKMKYFKRNRIF